MTLVCGQEVTLPDLNKPLDIVAYVEERLLQQGVQAKKYQDEDVCQFRVVVDGKQCACAIGWLIPDDYAEHPWSYLYKIVDNNDKAMAYWRLTSELRDIHNHNLPSEWPRLFKELRTKYST